MIAMIVAAACEFVAWLLWIFHVHHGPVIAWQSFMLLGLILAFVHFCLMRRGAWGYRAVAVDAAGRPVA